VGFAELLAIALIAGASPEELGAAHRASAELIQSAHVVLRVKRRFERSDPIDGSVKLVESASDGEFWCKPGLVRGHETLGHLRSDWLHRNGVEYHSASFKEDQSLPWYSAGRRSSHRSSHYLDVWSYTLFTLERLRIDEYFAKHRDCLSVSRETFNGAKCEVVTADHRSHKYKMQFWLDPSVNYLVRAMRMIMDNGSILESEITAFREHQPGVFFPERVVRRSRPPPNGKDEVPWDEEAVLVAEINRPVPDDVFQIKYHSGVVFVDELNGTMYAVDAEGRRTGPVQQGIGGSPEAPLANSPILVPASDSTATPGWMFLMAVSIAGIVVSLFVLGRARVKKRI
jgi:hypothetical protein